MKIHILGICGTFMAGIAAIAKQLGHDVRGCDAKVYPPMSTQLEEQGIQLIEGFEVDQLDYQPDVIIVGNAMTRGKPIVEHILNNNLAYTSGPQWLYENVLHNRWVLAVSGTHGKTTTASMLTWLLEAAGHNPSFLIGGVPENFESSARVTDSEYFVIEADEYDTAFFDKRSKFVHYHPRTLIINNLEFDHADIFSDLAAIQTQFHHLLRMMPSEGLILTPANEADIDAVIEQGCWTPVETLGNDWQFSLLKDDGSAFTVKHDNETADVNWDLLGQHNVHNAVAAIAAAHHAGVNWQQACQSFSDFKNVKRRLEIRAEKNGITVYDDFAHHPTAIATTLQGLRAKVGTEKIIAIAELGSYTMRAGIHKDTIIPAFDKADEVYLYLPEDAEFELAEQANVHIFHNIDSIVGAIKPTAPCHVVIMSNRAFGGIHAKIISNL
tara:strand:+ start:70812 stop:72128 length:1317 start_codon:yes stop_codon:yes gene_type:complete